MRFGSKFRPGERVSTWTEFGGRRGIVATGAFSDTISGGYRILQFQSDGEITVYDQSIPVEYLIVGGGGGGGPGRSAFVDNAPHGYGGGGGGQVVTNVGSPVLIAPGKYKIVVGAGGTSSSTASYMGQSSIFNGVIAYGGGTGSVLARGETSQGWNGGGGSASNSGTSQSRMNPGKPFTFATTGFAGGDYADSADTVGAGGGGGGSGGVGGNATTSVAGAGGAGVANSITGTSVTYGGGGGGGMAGGAGTAGTGTDGGGNGGKNAAGSNGVNGRGGGGGGAGADTSTALAGGNGGSGVVIIRYAV